MIKGAKIVKTNIREFHLEALDELFRLESSMCNGSTIPAKVDVLGLAIIEKLKKAKRSKQKQYGT